MELSAAFNTSSRTFSFLHDYLTPYCLLPLGSSHLMVTSLENLTRAWLSVRPLDGREEENLIILTVKVSSSSSSSLPLRHVLHLCIHVPAGGKERESKQSPQRVSHYLWFMWLEVWNCCHVWLVHLHRFEFPKRLRLSQVKVCQKRRQTFQLLNYEKIIGGCD